MLETDQDKIMNSIIFKIHRLVIISDKIADSQLQSLFGLTLSQFLLMLMFHLLPQTNQRLAADTLNITPAAVSKQIEKLEKQGWLVKSQNQADRRQHFWQMTLTGKKIFQEASKYIDELASKMNNLLSPEELLIFNNCLDKILNNSFESYEKQINMPCK